MNIKRFMVTLILFFGLQINCFPQTVNSKLLSELKISKIITNRLDSLRDSGTVNRISILNGSGKVIKEINLNSDFDTFSIFTFCYDTSNNLLSYEFVAEGHKSSTIYKKISKFKNEINSNINGKISSSISEEREIIRKRKTKYNYYINGKLVYKEMIRTKKNIVHVKIKYRNGDIKLIKEYLDSNKNIKYSESISYYSNRNKNTESKFINIKKKVKHKREQRTIYEYDSNNLLIKKIQLPSNDFKSNNYTFHGNKYQIEIYTYLTE